MLFMELCLFDNFVANVRSLTMSDEKKSIWTFKPYIFDWNKNAINGSSIHK